MDNNIKAIIESARNREEMEVLSSDRISTGFLKVDRVTVKTDQGPLVREVLQKKNVVAVLAMTEDERVLLCAQPRAGSNQRTSIEIPAGLIDGGETPEEAAKRELLEETGYEATEMIRLRGMHGDPACCNSLTTLFLASGCKKVAEQHLDSDEMLVYFDVSWEEFADLVEKEVIFDANTAMAYYATLIYALGEIGR